MTLTNNTAAIGFEQQIWGAADILRGNMDAAEYKHVVLGLMTIELSQVMKTGIIGTNRRE